MKASHRLQNIGTRLTQVFALCVGVPVHILGSLLYSRQTPEEKERYRQFDRALAEEKANIRAVAETVLLPSLKGSRVEPLTREILKKWKDPYVFFEAADTLSQRLEQIGSFNPGKEEDASFEIIGDDFIVVGDSRRSPIDSEYFVGYITDRLYPDIHQPNQRQYEEARRLIRWTLEALPVVPYLLPGYNAVTMSAAGNLVLDPVENQWRWRHTAATEEGREATRGFFSRRWGIKVDELPQTPAARLPGPASSPS